LILCLVCYTFADESVTITVSYGGVGFCEVCNSEDYALNTGSYWDNGQRSFQDPIPANSMVTQITVMTTDVTWCTTPYTTGTFNVNGVTINDFSSPYQCSCNSCPTVLNIVSSYYSSGFPGYNYGMSNNIQALIDNSGVIGIGAIQLQISYTGGNSGLMNSTVSIPFIGCGFCDMCGSVEYSLSNMIADCGEGIWDDGFRYFDDPLPAGATLVQVYIATAQVFWCETPVYVMFEVSGTYAGTITNEYEDCGCNTCPGVLYSSSSVYDMGFPGYKYGHSNAVQIMAQSGVIGVQSIDVILSYSQNN